MKKPRNPKGREGDKIEIALPFEDAVRAALQTKSPPKTRRGSRRKKRAEPSPD